jgi:hypothetical protein
MEPCLAMNYSGLEVSRHSIFTEKLTLWLIKYHIMNMYGGEWSVSLPSDIILTD